MNTARKIDTSVSQVRNVKKSPVQIRHILCLGMVDNGPTVLCKYLARKALDDLQIAGIQIESAGIQQTSRSKASSHIARILKKRNINCSTHTGRSVNDSNSIETCDLVLCTDQTSREYAGRALDGSVEIVLIEGLGSLSDLAGKNTSEHNRAAEIINTFVRKFFRDYADALAEQE